MSNYNALPEEGYLRLKQIIGDPKADPPKPGIFPVAKSTWYAGIKTGRFPAPDKRFGVGLSLWKVADIRLLIDPEAE